MTSIYQGNITPHSILSSQLVSIVQPRRIDSPREIADELQIFLNFLPRTTRLGFVTHLRRESRRVVHHLLAGRLSKKDLLKLEAHQDLKNLHQLIEGGSTLREAFFGNIPLPRNYPRVSSGTLLVPPQVRPNRIDWKRYGNFRFPAPPKPSARIQTHAQEVSYLLEYIVSYKLKSNDPQQIAQFYEMSPESYNHALLDGQLFCPKIFETDSKILEGLLRKASSISRAYAELLRELLLRALFEGFGWIYEIPQDLPQQASWGLYLQCHLRHFVAHSLLTQDGHERLTRFQKLVRAAQDHTEIETIAKETKRPRRLLIEKWLLIIFSPQMRRVAHLGSINEVREELARRWMSDYHMHLPRQGQSRLHRLQGMTQYWIAREWHGALPNYLSANGQFVSSEPIMRFALHASPEEEVFRPYLLTLFGNFYSHREKQRLLINPSRMRGQ